MTVQYRKIFVLYFVLLDNNKGLLACYLLSDISHQGH